MDEMQEILKFESLESRIKVIEEDFKRVMKTLDSIDGSVATLWIRFQVLEDRMNELELKKGGK